MSKHSRRRFDDFDFQPTTNFQPLAVTDVRVDDVDARDVDLPDGEPSLSNPNLSNPNLSNPNLSNPNLSNYVDAARGPKPFPEWVITSGDAIDEDLGVLKTGKEADVSLLRRSHGTRSSLMAVKRYRSAQHRMFHRDSGYLEGRRERRSRETRAMATRTEFGRELLAGKWAAAEFDVLARLWSLGAAVPYPVQLIGTELMMEFVGSADGVAAPRLAEIRPDVREARSLYGQMRAALVHLTDAGYAHGDLSPYNVLVDDGRLVLIDLPQAVDLVGNPQGFTYLRRDCVNICTWFAARGVDADAADLEDELLQIYDRRG